MENTNLTLFQKLVDRKVNTPKEIAAFSNYAVTDIEDFWQFVVESLHSSGLS